MDAAVTQEQRYSSAQRGRRGPLWRRAWPAAFCAELDILVAAFVAAIALTS